MDYLKISFEDLEIAKEYFENEKLYQNWLYFVTEYYQNPTDFEQKFIITNKKVLKYFKVFTSLKSSINGY